jgi:Holliday junction resolvasome RuvABC endonuclease subunit
MKFIAFDLSTSCAGYATGENGQITNHGYVRFDLKKKKVDNWNHNDLVSWLLDEVEDKIDEADVVVVEDALRAFGGRTTRRSVNVLIEFNAIVQYEARRRGKKVVAYHPSTARKQSFIGKGKRPDDYDDTKKWVLDEVADWLDIEWSRTRYDNVRKQHEDEADAVVLASAFINDEE